MTLERAISSFILHNRQQSDGEEAAQSSAIAHSLELLSEYLPRAATLNDIRPDALRDFLARWYLERAGSDLFSEPTGSANSSSPAGGLAPRDIKSSKAVPEPKVLINSLAQFFKWTDEQFASGLTVECLPVLTELSESLPRALTICSVLSNEMAERGGAFSFPEFLTSFEEGGHSEYDIGEPGETGVIEGYFRIIRIEGAAIEAEEMISERRIRPVLFPARAAEHLAEDYIINLELIRAQQGWQISACGFCYPPGTKM